MEEYKEYKHNPPHLFRSNAKYFITGATYEKKYFLLSDKAKARVFKSLYKGFNSLGWTLEDWVILHNHYHVMVNAPGNAESLSAIIRDIHKFTALWIKKNISDSKNAEKIWWNYWDTCITYEKSYFTRLNYIWFNPVKHGLIEKAEDWKFGSYYYRYKTEEEYLQNLRKKYPFDKVKVKDDF